MNKAIQAQLAPGSTFKIIMATAGLQEGIAQNMKVNCTGGASFYGRYFQVLDFSPPPDAHGGADITEVGVDQSCDTFFYTLAERLGHRKDCEVGDKRSAWDKRANVDLPQEATGVMPSEEWKLKTFHQKWYRR